MDTDQTPTPNTIITPNQNPTAPQQPIAPQIPTVQPPAPETKPQKHSPKKMKLVIWALVVVILVGGLATAYILSRPEKKADQVSNEKKEIQLINYGTADGPVNRFYPDVTGNSVDFEVNEQVFEGLVQYENETRIKPLLATSWTNPDDSTWVFKLKEGVKFHTGTVMTAKDVKFSLENYKTTEWGKIFAGTIKSADVVDDYTVKVTTNGPDPILLNKLVFMFIVDSTSTLKNDTANGTGPYTLKTDSKPTDTLSELVAYDDYHGGRAQTRAITFKGYTEESALIDALKKGEINIAADVFDQANIDAAGNSVSSYPLSTGGVYEIGINHNKQGSAVRNLKIRQAMYEATDIPALIKARNASGEAASQFVTKDITGYNPSITRPARNVEHAKQLIKESGIANPTLTLTYYSAAQDAADELARQLAEVGITIKPDVSSDVAAIENKIGNGQAEIWFGSYASDVLDSIDVFTANFQGANYKKPETDLLITEASQTLDPTKRLEILQSISKKLMDDVAWVPLYSNTVHWLVDPSYVFTRDVPGNNFGVYFWKTYAK